MRYRGLKRTIGGLKVANKYPVEIDGITGELETLPHAKGTRYRAKLDSISDVKREMAKVYREARSGVVDVQDATKLTWCLQAVAKVIETSDLEKRIELLEASK
jgi:hypothetical protein